MLILLGTSLVLLAVVVVARMRTAHGVHASALGWMSEQWLAEHRSSHDQ